jgi:peptide/nickel transport system substrate-binding protein
MIKKRQLKKLIVALVALVSILGINIQNIHLVVGAAAADCTPSGTVKRGGELRFARLEEPLTFDPTVPGDNGSIWLITQVFNTLIRVDVTGTGLEPDLARSWDTSQDRLTYTFHLRDAKFSNGNPVTADDVVFSYGRAKVGSYAFIFDPLDKVEKVDAHTVKMTLKRPYTPFLSVAALFQAAIVPKDVYEANKDTFGDHPVGSGPFMVQQYTRGDKVVLVPNPNYWELGADCKPLPYLDKITVPFVADSNARVLGFRNHDYDVIGNVPPNESKNIQSMSGVTLEVAPIYRLDYILLNHKDPVLSNKDFRLALNYAVDRKVILDLVFFGYGEIPNGFMPKMNYWSKDVPAIPYDVAKAQQLLASAGYKGEAVTIMIPAGDAPSKQIATIFQQFWSQVGVNVRLQEVDASSFFGILQEGKYQAAVSYITSDINDDDELATLMADFQASGFNAFFSWYQNKEVTKLLQQARESGDPAERTKLYAQIQQTVYWDGYSVPYNFNPVLNAYYSYVKGWKNLATGWWWLKSVWMDK